MKEREGCPGERGLPGRGEVVREKVVREKEEKGGALPWLRRGRRKTVQTPRMHRREPKSPVVYTNNKHASEPERCPVMLDFPRNRIAELRSM